MTESDYNLRLMQAAVYIEKLDAASDIVALNSSLTKTEKVTDLNHLRKLKHRLTKGNDDLQHILRNRRRERRREK